MSDKTAKHLELITAAKSRPAYTVRLTHEMYDFLSSMSDETGIPLSTLVRRGLTIGVMVSAKLEAGIEDSWSTETMTAKQARLTVQQPEKQVAGWTGRVFAVSSDTFPPIDEVVAQGIRREKGEL
jgi:hypothetical protein